MIFQFSSVCLELPPEQKSAVWIRFELEICNLSKQSFPFPFSFPFLSNSNNCTLWLYPFQSVTRHHLSSNFQHFQSVIWALLHTKTEHFRGHNNLMNLPQERMKWFCCRNYHDQAELFRPRLGTIALNLNNRSFTYGMKGTKIE